MGRKYTIYQLTSPCGGIYIGYTSLSIKERWRKHKDRALSGYSLKHPFYNAIRKYNAENFTLEAIHTFDNLHSALAEEKRQIAKIPASKRLNLSPGGSDDARFGGEIFWERLNANLEEKEAYLKRLSAGIKRNIHKQDYASLKIAAANWRNNNPKKAYKMSMRALRIANRKPCK